MHLDKILGYQPEDDDEMRDNFFEVVSQTIEESNSESDTILRYTHAIWA